MISLGYYLQSLQKTIGVKHCVIHNCSHKGKHYAFILFSYLAVIIKPVMTKTAAEKTRLFREKLKADPDKWQKYKAKQASLSADYRAATKAKRTDQEAELHREYEKQRKREQRARKKKNLIVTLGTAKKNG